MCAMFGIMQDINIFQFLTNAFLYAIVLTSVAASFMFRKNAARNFAARVYCITLLFITATFIRTAINDILVNLANHLVFLNDYIFIFAFKNPLIMIEAACAAFVVSAIRFNIQSKPEKIKKYNSVKFRKKPAAEKLTSESVFMPTRYKLIS